MFLFNLVHKGEKAFGKHFRSYFTAGEQIFQIVFRFVGKAQIGDGNLNLAFEIDHVAFDFYNITSVKFAGKFTGILPHIGRDAPAAILQFQAQVLIVLAVAQFFFGSQIEADYLFTHFLVKIGEMCLICHNLFT